MNKVRMNLNDLEQLAKIVEDNKLSAFTLVQDNSSGIGYTTVVEFVARMNDRDATVTMDIATSENW